MTANKELLSASDAQIDDAMQYASPMVLRGLLYQLTGDSDVIGMAPGTAAKFGAGREMADEADADLLKAKGGGIPEAISRQRRRRYRYRPASAPAAEPFADGRS